MALKPEKKSDNLVSVNLCMIAVIPFRMKER